MTEQLLKTRLQQMKYSWKTEKAYLYWDSRFKSFTKKDTRNLKEKDLSDFITHLAVKKNVSKSTQRLALNALVFCYRNCLKINPQLDYMIPANKGRKLPTVLTKPMSLSKIRF